MQSNIQQVCDVKSEVQADIGLRVLACEIGGDTYGRILCDVQVGKLLQRF